MLRTRIKFCGITRLEDLQLAAQLGVDALGFVFHPSSPRAVNVQQACALSEHCPPFISRVGLFMNQDSRTINRVLERVALDVLQFHGDEPEALCASFGLPYIKSVAMGSDIHPACSDHARALALLFDSNQAGQAGGCGRVFDWNKVPALSQPVILAGGLNAGNVRAAIQTVRPYAVDVSSGIEEVKGIKSKSRMKSFVNAVRATDEIIM